MKRNLEGSQNRDRLVCPVILTLLMLAIGGLCLLTVHSSDDFWYSTFLDEGLGPYIGKMADHYRTFNGRVWVHILAHILLYTGNWLFALVCCGCVLAMPLLMGRAAGGDRSRCMMGAVLFGILFAAMPVSFFVEGVLWISAFCNYLVPTLVLCLMFWQLEEDRPAPGLMLSAFLCGSATEQMGMMALALLLMYLLADPRKRKLRMAALVCAAGGLATVFASPATGSRAAGEVPLDSIAALWDRVVESLGSCTYILACDATIPALLAALSVLCGWTLKPRFRIGLPMGCIGAGLWLGAWAAFGGLRIILCAAALILLGLLALGMLLTGHRLRGSMILTALVSVAVMLPTSSVGCRNLLPFYVLAVLAVGSLAADLLPRRWEKPFHRTALVCTVLVLAQMLPLAKGAVTNYRLDRLNRQYAEDAAQQSTVLYDAGYDLRYTFKKAYLSDYFTEKYLESVGLPAGTGLELRSGEHPLPRILCCGNTLSLPAIPYRDGPVLVPIRPVMDALGGSLRWQGSRLDLELDGIQCRLYSMGDQQVRAEWTDESGNRRRLDLSRTLLYANGCYEARLLTEVFGLDVRWDPETQTYTIDKQ